MGQAFLTEGHNLALSVAFEVNDPRLYCMRMSFVLQKLFYPQTTFPKKSVNQIAFRLLCAPKPVLEPSKVSGGGGTHGASVETESDYCLPFTPKTDFLVCRKTERGVILKGEKRLEPVILRRHQT